MYVFKKIRYELKKQGGLQRAFKKIYVFLKNNGLNSTLLFIRKKLFDVNRAKKINKNENVYCENYFKSLTLNLRSNFYEKCRNERIELEHSPIKLIAFYLPQFHPFKENEEWWGKGFTEWANVTKAVPHFLGHYQPKLPSDLGFYDLRLIENQKRQIEIAQKYGIYGFCYYYYWFSGKKLMEKPLEQVLYNKELDFPFCICWANENWTRNWDGRNDQILIEQKYLPGYELEFIKEITEILKDNRYIKIKNKPLIIIYAVFDLPDISYLVQVWRNYCKEIGIGEIFIAGVKRFEDDKFLKNGLDALIEFPPHCVDKKSVLKEMTVLYPDYQGEVYDYKEVVNKVKLKIEKETKDNKVIHGIMPSWDNTARKPEGKGTVYVNASPCEYEKWLLSLCEHLEERHSNEEKVIFLNAWNEWAEGAYLEPDRYWGYTYLEKTAQVLEKMDCKQYIKFKQKNFREKLEKRGKIAVILHLYFFELWYEIVGYLENMPEKFDLYISLPQRFNVQVIKDILDKFPNVVFRVCENKGRDIAPFLNLMAEISNLDYELVCKLHSKKSAHLDDGKGWKKEVGKVWRSKIFEELLGNKEKIEKILYQFRTNEKIGIIGPKGNFLNIADNIGSNKERLTKLCEELSIIKPSMYKFFAGSMFWLRPHVMKDILILGLKNDDFEDEKGQLDGTLAHALERVFVLAAGKLGYISIETG